MYIKNEQDEWRKDGIEEVNTEETSRVEGQIVSATRGI